MDICAHVCASTSVGRICMQCMLRITISKIYITDSDTEHTHIYACVYKCTTAVIYVYN